METEIFESTHKVRDYECDFYGHVNNAIYLNYLEFARMEVLEKKGFTLAGLKAAGFVLVVREIHILYKFPAVAGDIIIIRSRLKSFTNTTGTFHQQIVRDRDEKLLLEADVTWAALNLDGRPVRIPQIIRDGLGLRS
jgi:acyl-CoA thioester hydrolase